MTSEWLVALFVRQTGKGTRTKGFEGKIVSQELLKDVQPALDAWEYEEAERVVKQNPEFQAAMQRRGVTVSEASRSLSSVPQLSNTNPLGYVACHG